MCCPGTPFKHSKTDVRFGSTARLDFPPAVGVEEGERFPAFQLDRARVLRDAGGIPNHGNGRQAWQAGCRFDYENPEHRA